MTKPCVHLICNAHLDPVWQWQWEEGCAEALATFRSAVQLLRQHESFIFNHNESLLYRWVERFDPSLFAEIRKLVTEGRWCIMGGWHLQPDANMPGLESALRQITEGRIYFAEKFGVRPRVACNFDAFGHHGGLPQLLRLFGYEMYVHMRPQQHELALPSDLYQWRGVDGSVIPALRISIGLYHTERDNIEERLREGVDAALSLGRDVPVFWGLGNHGGGATRRDLALIDSFTRKEKRVLFRHSTPEILCGALKEAARTAPVVEGDLQRAFPGCYTSLSRLKRRARRSLGLLVQTEALCAAAWWAADADYPEKEIDSAWRDHLLNDFHDILPGSCTCPAERDALDLYGRASETARRARFAAAAAFSTVRTGSPALPLLVMNSNPAAARGPVEVEFMSDYRPFWNEAREMRLFTRDGRPIVCQEEKPEALLPFHDWRRKICFMADLPGLGISRYRIESEIKGPERYLPLSPAVNYRFDKTIGLITQIADADGNSCLAGPLFQPLAVEDQDDSWGTGGTAWREPAGRFEIEPESVRIRENGPVRTIFESVHTFRSSRIVMRTIVYAGWPVIEVRCRVRWNEPAVRLKLSVPCRFPDSAVECEIPGGVIPRPADGLEHVHGRWLIIEGGETALGIVNSGQHGFDFRNGEVRLSVLRSAAYCHERGLDLSDREPARMDMGNHSFDLLAMPGRVDRLRAELPGLADRLDAPPVALAHLPGDRADRPILDIFSRFPAGVRLTACKRSRDGKALIVRLHESTGRENRCDVALENGGSAKLVLKPFEITTLRFEKNGEWNVVTPCRET